MTDETKLLSFSEMGLGFGQVITLIPNPADKTQEFDCVLIGCLVNESLIIGPSESGLMPRLQEGQRVVIRTKLSAGVAVFSAMVLFVSEIPTIMVYLDYPQKVKFKQLRDALRVRVVLPVLVKNLSDPRFSNIAGKIIDISTGGAGLELFEVLGQPGHKIELKGKFEVGAINRLLTIPAVIRSAKSVAEVYSYGIEFYSADEDSLLVMFGFIFHAMAFKQIQPIR